MGEREGGSGSLEWEEEQCEWGERWGRKQQEIDGCGLRRNRVSWESERKKTESKKIGGGGQAEGKMGVCRSNSHMC